MYRGTTPNFELIFDYNLEDFDIEKFYVTIKQGNKLIIEKELKDITIDKEKAIITLTQEDTLKMEGASIVLVQAKLKINGLVYSTNIVSTGIADILKEGVI